MLGFDFDDLDEREQAEVQQPKESTDRIETNVKPVVSTVQQLRRFTENGIVGDRLVKPKAATSKQPKIATALPELGAADGELFVEPNAGPGIELNDLWGPPGPVAGDLLHGWNQLATAFNETASDAQFQKFREAKCYAAAVAWSLLQLPPKALVPPKDRPVRVWIVGARTIMEGKLAQDGEWKLLADVFPDLQWELVLVGPEMHNSEGFATADGGLGRVQAQGVCLKGHEWAKQAPCSPDFVVVFNSGVGTMALALVRHWLETLEALLGLNVPILFTCFSVKERRGEELLLQQLFKARVLAGFFDNLLKPHAEDKPIGYVRQMDLPPSVDVIESDTESRLCNAVVWWAKGSHLSRVKLHNVTLVQAPEVLKNLIQTFALKAFKGWLATLKDAKQNIGDVVLENLAVATENPTVAKLFARQSKLIVGVIVKYVQRVGQHPLARPCVERILFAAVRPKAEASVPDKIIWESVHSMIDEQYGDALLKGGC